MTVVTNATFKTPVVRVLEKDANILFYQQTLGMKLVSEENALAIFSAYDNADRVFIMEESPTYRTRAVNGTTKHRKTNIRASKASDIAALLATGISVDQVYHGQVGYAFEATSPQGYTYLLHAEEAVDTLEAIERPILPTQEGFKGLADFEVESIVLNVPDVAAAEAFYHELDLPLDVDFVLAEGEDLQVDPDTVWDLEYLEFSVPEETDLSAMKADLEAKGLEVYLDNKARVLVVSDTSKIELWFTK